MFTPEEAEQLKANCERGKRGGVKLSPTKKPNPKAIGRTKRGVLNKLETRFANECLVGIDYDYESMRFKVGGGAAGFAEAWYTPDFSYMRPSDNKLVVTEVKGHKERAGMVRFKAAVLRYPHITWELAEYIDKQWKITQF